jgi:DNA polymerase-3 subunit chi
MADSRMAEILFYQLERRPLESALPDLLQRSLERGWRVVVKVGSDERLEALNAHLWTYDEASFLPHGAAADGNAAEQPVWLTTGDDNPNGATVRFLVDGAETADFSGYDRVVFIFDAADAEALAKAREAWKGTRVAGGEATYWRQDENGRWMKQG